MCNSLSKNVNKTLFRLSASGMIHKSSGLFEMNHCKVEMFFKEGLFLVTCDEQVVSVCSIKTAIWPEMLLLCSLAIELCGYGRPLIRFPAH